jgi:hypothetical protein
MFTIKNMTIRRFYTICKKLGENCVVTIGKDLISRGISYVSEDIHEPLTATTMIYKPGTKMHAVGISQTIGRVTGCAMPNLTRRVYAPKDVIETYIAYNENAEEYLSKMEQEGKLTKDVISEMIFRKFKRSIDRQKLKLKMNMKASSCDILQDGVIDGVNLNKLDKWISEEDISLVGKMIRYLYHQTNNVDIDTFRKEVGFEGDLKQFADNIDNGRSLNAKYGKLWHSINSNSIIKMNEKIREYINSKLD